jgi:type II secretory pathway component PulJ
MSPPRGGRGESGMSMPELVIVIAISSLVLGMVFSVVASFAKNDARNLTRQNRVDEVRQVGLWLGDALSYAAAPAVDPGLTPGPVFEVAAAQKMVFTSALGAKVPGHEDVLSKVTVVLGEDCHGQPADRVLYRCVQHPYEQPDGSLAYCQPGAAGCSDDLTETTLMARDVKDVPVFTYFGSNGGPGTGLHDVPDPDVLKAIEAVEFKVTATVPEGSDITESTVLKRYSIGEWRRW